jgi:4-azaleucine resistance transporter AzlC
MEQRSINLVNNKPEETSTDKKHIQFYNGMKYGTSIAIGYIPIAITFGLLAKSHNIPSYISTAMSFLVFAGASQFIAVQLISLGASSWEIIFTTFILNFRHFLMSSSLSQKLPQGISKKILYLLSFGITDETFAMASLKEEKKLNPYFILGLNSIAFISWNIGTWIGIFAANGLPQILRTSMGIALYAMFIALLVPSIKGSKQVLIVSLLSIGLNSLIHYMPLLSRLSSGWAIIISTVISALIGTILFPSEVN